MPSASVWFHKDADIRNNFAKVVALEHQVDLRRPDVFLAAHHFIFGHVALYGDRLRIFQAVVVRGSHESGTYARSER